MPHGPFCGSCLKVNYRPRADFGVGHQGCSAACPKRIFADLAASGRLRMAVLRANWPLEDGYCFSKSKTEPILMGARRRVSFMPNFSIKQSWPVVGMGSEHTSDAMQDPVICCFGQRRGVGVGGCGGSEDPTWKHQTHPPFSRCVLLGARALSVRKGRGSRPRTIEIVPIYSCH